MERASAYIPIILFSSSYHKISIQLIFTHSKCKQTEGEMQEIPLPSVHQVSLVEASYPFSFRLLPLSRCVPLSGAWRQKEATTCQSNTFNSHFHFSPPASAVKKTEIQHFDLFCGSGGSEMKRRSTRTYEKTRKLPNLSQGGIPHLHPSGVTHLRFEHIYLPCRPLHFSE